MTRLADAVGHWLGLCRKAPVLRTAPSAGVIEPESAFASIPGGSGPAGSAGGVRDGIRIATESLKAFYRDRQLFWFMLLAGLVMLLLAGWEAWMLARPESVLPFFISIPLESPLIVNRFLAIDLQVFLLESVCLSLFVLILAGLVLYRDGNRGGRIATVLSGFTRINGHTGSLLALSILMAVIATGLEVMVSQTRLVGGIVSGIAMAVFYLPYAYYVPDELSSVIFFSALLMAINSILLLAALFVVPGIVLEKKRLVPALGGAMATLRGAWREALGCLLVFGGIILGVTAIALLIGQSPLLLSHDYDFFLQESRGLVLMTAVCYGFIAACFGLIAFGITAAGVIGTTIHEHEAGKGAGKGVV